MKCLKQSSNAQPLLFLLIQSSDHISPLTGATPTVTLSKNGGSFASPAGAVTEIGGGWYKVAGNGTDTNTLGPLVLHATATSADPADYYFEVVAYDPQVGTNLGLSALPTASPGATGGLVYSPNNSNVVTGVLNTVIASVNGYSSMGAAAALANPLYLAWSGSLSPNPTGQIFAQDVDTVVYNSREVFYNGNSWRIWWNGTSLWVLSSVVGTLGTAYWTSPTLSGTWTPNGTATGSPVFVVLGGAENPASTTNIITVGAVSGNVAGSVNNVVGNVGGNVSGSVGSVVGAVGSVTGNVVGNVLGSVASVASGVTVATNNDKSGYSLTVSPPTVTDIANTLFVDGVTNKLKVNTDHSVNVNASGNVVTIGSFSDPAILQMQTALYQKQMTIINNFTCNGSRLTLVAGDAYTAALGTSLNFPLNGDAGLVGTTAHLRIEGLTDDLVDSPVVTDANQQLIFNDVLGDVTILCPIGDDIPFQVHFKLGSDVTTKMEGLARIKVQY